MVPWRAIVGVVVEDPLVSHPRGGNERDQGAAVSGGLAAALGNAARPSAVLRPD